METIDDEVLEKTIDFIRRQDAAGIPFFVWFNTTHMHFRTYVKPGSRGQAGRWQSEYHDVMIDHDKAIGVLLNLLEELGIVDNTFVMYSTDNGPHCNTWPDAGTTPFRSEKNTSWEGAYRVPCLIRWPGHIKPGSVSNGIVAHLDWLPTLASIAGEPDIKGKLLKGHKMGDRTYKVHIDGMNQHEHITGKSESARQGFVYWTDEAELAALRVDNWKMLFMEQRVPGTCLIWAEPMVTLRAPKLFNLRTDPYEFADITSNTYYDWWLDRAFLLLAGQPIVADFLKSFAEFPPRQKAASFNLSAVLEKMEQHASGGA
jgi:arylsulfatase